MGDGWHTKGALGVQTGGDHYKKHKIQPIEYIQANNLGYIEGNIVKYITRYEDKGGKEDLLKIKHYVDLLMESKYGDAGATVPTNDKPDKPRSTVTFCDIKYRDPVSYPTDDDIRRFWGTIY